MLNHALKLIWNRRRANRLLIVEIAAVFVVVFVLCSLSVRAWVNYQRPLGFEYEDIWQISTSTPAGFFETDTDTFREDVLPALRALPQTLSAHAIGMPPFTDFTWSNGLGSSRDSITLTRLNMMSADALRALGVRLIDGRWYGPQDEGQSYQAVVANRTFVERAFGDESPLGRRINFPDPEYVGKLDEEAAQEAMREIRVVGIIEDFRQWGEFSDDRAYVINQPGGGNPFPLFGSNFFIKVAPGTEAAFEEQIVETIESIAPDRVVTVTPWEQLRETRHANELFPLKAGGSLAAFFLALVVMGLIGVLWQDVVRRTQEIGLRRAVGASGGGIRGQIVLEMLVVGSVGILIGTVIAVQIPLLELVPQIRWASALPALILTGMLLLLLAALAAAYPAWLASRREPADALRYE